MHKNVSPVVRYELSRVSALLFIAMGTRKLHCRSESRSGLLLAWFGPMLLDFGWPQRCRKGLDMKALEEAMGQTLLTLPLKQQYMLFMEWFRCFSKHGTECPNLSKAFQIWWHRSFLRGSETYAIETRILRNNNISDSIPVTIGEYQSLWQLGSCFGDRNGNELEPGRCRRTDGKKWRCSRDVVPNQKYCEQHMHRGAKKRVA
ncbi:hypothetical protein SO802_032133 [Lithocarpus litseifolius]|uniref:WRC domain-containing protein n=1 Tax=Lithocarpus litseifolius TaxID=425828 RepID=A0AAW2BPT9_9ROSI